MAKEIVSGIYSITNTVNGKRYVGSSNNIHKRFISGHKSLLNRGAHENVKLQRAWSKYGEDAFVLEVLEIVADQLVLFEREQFWIDHFQAADKSKGYNVSPGAGGSRGLKQSQETKDKRAAKLRGRKRPEVGPAISAALKGKPKSAEHRAKISENLKKREFTEQMREKRRLYMTGRKMPREGVLKSVASRAGYVTSEETKRKQSEKKRGMVWPREVVERRAASLKATLARKRAEKEKQLKAA